MFYRQRMCNATQALANWLSQALGLRITATLREITYDSRVDQNRNLTFDVHSILPQVMEPNLQIAPTLSLISVDHSVHQTMLPGQLALPSGHHFYSSDAHYRNMPSPQRHLLETIYHLMRYPIIYWRTVLAKEKLFEDYTVVHQEQLPTVKLETRCIFLRSEQQKQTQ